MLRKILLGWSLLALSIQVEAQQVVFPNNPIRYPQAVVSGQIIDFRDYGVVTLNCTTAPSAGSLAASPDNASDFVVQTLIMNNSGSISTTSVISSAAVYTMPGHQWIQVTLTGGTCFIGGGQ